MRTNLRYAARSADDHPASAMGVRASRFASGSLLAIAFQYHHTHRAETVTVRTVRNGYPVAMNDSAQIRPVPMRRRPWFADLEEAERRGAHGNAGLGYFDCDCEICHRRFRPAAV
ncbi:hypothetical protein [Nocardia nova]|uniref:hypothetical protein n=2 Tax=Nocardiaceae TaxID=85025 RepID=UPI002738D62E|nr:hypothetical protein [Nocardia nova]